MLEHRLHEIGAFLWCLFIFHGSRLSSTILAASRRLRDLLCDLGDVWRYFARRVIKLGGRLLPWLPTSFFGRLCLSWHIFLLGLLSWLALFLGLFSLWDLSTLLNNVRLGDSANDFLFGLLGVLRVFTFLLYLQRHHETILGGLLYLDDRLVQESNLFHFVLIFLDIIVLFLLVI